MPRHFSEAHGAVTIRSYSDPLSASGESPQPAAPLHPLPRGNRTSLLRFCPTDVTSSTGGRLRKTQKVRGFTSIPWIPSRRTDLKKGCYRTLLPLPTRRL